MTMSHMKWRVVVVIDIVLLFESQIILVYQSKMNRWTMFMAFISISLLNILYCATISQNYMVIYVCNWCVDG